MNKKTREAVVIIALLPKKEMKQMLSVSKAAHEIYSDLLTRRSFPLDEHKTYQRNKPALQEVLTAMGVEITGGTGGRGNKKFAFLKKI